MDRDRRIRKKRAYQNLAAELVYRMRTRVQENEPDIDSKTVSSLDGFCTECNVHHINSTGSSGIVHCLECPRTMKPIVNIQFMGMAGFGVNSPFDGHERWTGS